MIQTVHLGSLPRDCEIVPLEKIDSVVLAARPATIPFEAPGPRHEHEWIIRETADIADRRIA